MKNYKEIVPHVLFFLHDQTKKHFSSHFQEYYKLNT